MTTDSTATEPQNREETGTCPGCGNPDPPKTCTPSCPVLRIYNQTSQKWVDIVCHYRNLAIQLGAKPNQMLGKYDRDLAAAGFDTDLEGWDESTIEMWQELDAAEQARDAARKLAANLFQMIPVDTWRDTGGDDGQGHHEGEYRAAGIADEIRSWDE